MSPTYPRPLSITDAAINIYSDLEDKRDIVQNAIDLALVLEIENAKVAILSAIETVTPKIRSTIEAAALCKMADRKQITWGVVDSPLAFDNTVSEEAAKIKGIVSHRLLVRLTFWWCLILNRAICWQNSWNTWPRRSPQALCLARVCQLHWTSRPDNTLSRMASCAIALLLAQKRRAKP